MGRHFHVLVYWGFFLFNLTYETLVCVTVFRRVSLKVPRVKMNWKPFCLGSDVGGVPPISVLH